MRKINLFGFLLAIIVLSTSCNKDDDGPKSRNDLIVGTWTLNAFGVDDNMDGILQTAEYDPIPAGAGQIQIYRSDKTGVITTQATSGSPQSANMKWRFDNNDQNLIVTYDVAGNSTIGVVSQLTTTDLMGYDPSAAVRIIFLFKK